MRLVGSSALCGWAGGEGEFGTPVRICAGVVAGGRSVILRRPASPCSTAGGAGAPGLCRSRRSSSVVAEPRSTIRRPEFFAALAGRNGKSSIHTVRFDAALPTPMTGFQGCAWPRTLGNIIPRCQQRPETTRRLALRHYFQRKVPGVPGCRPLHLHRQRGDAALGINDLSVAAFGGCGPA